MEGLEELYLETLISQNRTGEIEEYYQQLENMKVNRISKKVVESLLGCPLTEIYQEIWKEEESVRSDIFFPGDLVLLHPSIQESRSRNYRTCDFSGALIRPHSLCINYRPLIENLNTKETFVLKKTIHVEPGYIHRLPKTIIELEQLESAMQWEQPDPEIDFSHFNRQMGEQLKLQKLRRN